MVVIPRSRLFAPASGGGGAGGGGGGSVVSFSSPFPVLALGGLPTSPGPVLVSARGSTTASVISPTPSGKIYTPRIGLSPGFESGKGGSPIRKRSNTLMMTSTGAPAFRILLTDDTQTILKVAGRLLRTNGHAGKGCPPSNTSSQPTFSSHPLKPPSQYTFSSHPFNPPSHPTLSTHPLIPHSQPTHSTHPYTHVLAVETATNGSQSLDKLKRGYTNQDIDLLLTDLQMPVMDGIECAKRFRAWEEEQQCVLDALGLPRRPRFVIVGMSANSDAQSRQDAMDAGMDLFCGKPFNYQDFESIVLSRIATISRGISGSNHQPNSNLSSQSPSHRTPVPVPVPVSNL